MFLSLSKFISATAIVACLAVALTSGYPLDGLREFNSMAERQFVGAGYITSKKCKSVTTFNCINNLVLGGACGPAGIDGVQCNTARAPLQCLSKFGIFDECTTTIVRVCPTGVIIKCVRAVWTNKNVGNAACGNWDDC